MILEVESFKKMNTKKLIKLKWHTEKRKVDELIPYDKNPRRMTEAQEAALKKSLERFGLVEIPAIDTDNIIIAGHQRLRILQLLGRGKEEVDVRVPNRKLTEGEFQEYNIRSNKNTGEWDYLLLAGVEKDLLKDIGFDDIDLGIIFESYKISLPEEKEVDENIMTQHQCPKCGYKYG